MSWQGVPFKLLEAGNVDQLFLKLSSLPKLTIDTPTDYSQLWLTVGATFLGGIIPALIAWRTFHVNAKNTKKEREEQQRFLQAERAKQQIFMMSERASQFASLKEDRELQTSISQKTINAQVLSVNRQNWINELRKHVADYCASFFILFNSRTDFLLVTDRFTTFKKMYESVENKKALKEAFDEMTSSFAAEINSYRSATIKVDSIKYTILMMINHHEDEGVLIKNCFYRLTSIISTLKLDANGEFENYNELYSESLNKTEELMEVTRTLLKKEWNRVKQGD